MPIPAAPARAAVAVVGAGIAGLAAAHRLQELGITNVVVLEARERVGGRVHRLPRPGRAHLEGGAETLEGDATHVLRLATRLGMERLPEPAVPEGARSVRIAHDGRRHVEGTPFAGDPAAAAAFGAAADALDALSRTVDPAAPWDAPNAPALDGRTLQNWLDEHVAHPEARSVLAWLFAENGGHADEVSLLFTLWAIRSRGGMGAVLRPRTTRLQGGPSALVERLAAGITAPVVLEAPVRRIERDVLGCTVATDRGLVRADAVVVALSPSLAAAIEFRPALPAARERLQQRWLQGHGAKAFAVYAARFWARAGLTGSATAPGPFPVVADHSVGGDGEGVLLGLVMGGSQTFRGLNDLLDDDAVLADRFVAHLVRCFGPDAAAPEAVHVRRWFGDPWAHGAGTGTPPGALSSVGAAIRTPIGRIVWAGAETGTVDHLEGAASSAVRAADEVAALLGVDHGSRSNPPSIAAAPRRAGPWVA